jgi:PPOX class probable F420-dependent enzyme
VTATSTVERTDETKEGWRGKIGLMDQQEMDEFLAGGNLARLAVLDDKGWPYVQPVWYQWDPAEGIFWIVARKKSAWAAFMQRDGRVALTIDGETRPYRKVALQGSAEVIEEPNVGGQWVEIAKLMASRYLGEHGPDYIVPTLDKPRWLFKITPTSLVTWQGVDWHSRYKE